LGEHGALAELIRRARRRHVSQIIVEQAFFSLAVALGGCIALLLFGTQILNGLWLAVLFAGSFLVGLYRAQSRILSHYRLAQVIDQRLHLQDSLSTAFYFGEHAEPRRAAPELIARQRALAEEAARSADLKVGLPFALPRSIYVGAGLAAVALTVFGVRYGVTHSLDLRPSLVQIAFNGLLGSEDVRAEKKKLAAAKADAARPKEPGLGVDPWESKTLDAEGAPDAALNTVDTPDVNNPNNSEANAKANGTKSKDPSAQDGESNGDSEQTPSGTDKMADNSASPDKDGGRQGKQKQGAQQDNKSGPSSSGENSSLADKMRDALSNLMSKLKMQDKPGEGNKQSQQQSAQQQSAQQRQGKDDKGSPQQGKQSDSASSQDQQGDQEGQNSEKASAAQNKSGSKSSDKPPSQDGKSGIGKEDGDKSAKEAEQLAAMGKISEIIGKRTANMSGEVMVEVASGKQQLKTQYSQRKATHADAGGEINRDEVPLAYQQFVQQYFEEIRKAPAGTTVKSKKLPGM
jgi:hypothetical protein